MNSGRWLQVVSATLLAVEGMLLVWAAWIDGPVINEPAHLVAGISNWELGRFGLYKVNPPLVRMLAAIPVMAAGVETDWSGYHDGIAARSEFTVAQHFIQANEARLFVLVVLARCAVIPLVLIGGWVSYRWASDLYGGMAGITALTMWCFCPNVLAYGHVINADAGATAMGIAASYAFWKWLGEPRWIRAMVAGILLGLAELAKTTWAVLFILWPITWLVWRCGATARRSAGNKPCLALPRAPAELARCPLWQLLLIFSLAVICINAGYNFEGTGTRLGDYRFLSRALSGDAGHSVPRGGNRFAKTLLGLSPVPLPRNYVEGIDLQWHDIEVGKPSYLRGRWKDHGWWYWYLYALAVKLPLGIWGMFLLAVGQRLAVYWRAVQRCSIGTGESPSDRNWKCESAGATVASATSQRTACSWRDELFLLATAMAVLVLVSSQTGFSRYIRYVLPVLPFLFIWAAGVARGVGWQRRKTAFLVIAFILWSAASTLWYAPHWMSYFNELAGGPLGGPAHLLDAQVDWGQDLLTLKRWLDAHRPTDPLALAYFGEIDPRSAGIQFSLPPRATRLPGNAAEIAAAPVDLRPGWYAISVNFLYGYPQFAPNGRGEMIFLDCGYFTYFRSFRPAATAGYSIYIYHLDDADIRAALHPGDEANQ